MPLAVLTSATAPATLAATIPWSRVVTWVVALVVVAILGSIVLVWLRRALMSDTPSMDAGTGFGLRELDAMHQRGELSDEEHQRARAKMLAALTGPSAAGDAASPPVAPLPPADPPDHPSPDDPQGPPGDDHAPPDDTPDKHAR